MLTATRVNTRRAIKFALSPERYRHLAPRVLGLSAVALISACFWSELVNIGAGALGYELTNTPIALLVLTITFFLMAVLSPIILRDHTDTRFVGSPHNVVTEETVEALRRLAIESAKPTRPQHASSV